MQKVNIPKARHLEPLRNVSIIFQCQQHLKHTSKIGIIYHLCAHKRMMLRNSRTQPTHILRDLIFNGHDSAIFDDSIEKILSLRF